MLSPSATHRSEDFVGIAMPLQPRLGMAYARISLGVHFPTDTLGGLVLGLGWFAATAALI
jgi:hypothetical protein